MRSTVRRPVTPLFVLSFLVAAAAAARTKAGLLELKGDTKAAADLRDHSMKIATEADINGYQLLDAGKTEEAIEMFKKNVRDHPQSWNVYDSLGEAYDRKGDKKLAVENYRRAQSLVRDPDNQKRIKDILARLNG